MRPLFTSAIVRELATVTERWENLQREMETIAAGSNSFVQVTLQLPETATTKFVDDSDHVISGRVIDSLRLESDRQVEEMQRLTAQLTFGEGEEVTDAE